MSEVTHELFIHHASWCLKGPLKKFIETISWYLYAGKLKTVQKLIVLPCLHSPPYLFSRKICTQSHSAEFLNWGDHVNSVPDLAASPPWWNVTDVESWGLTSVKWDTSVPFQFLLQTRKKCLSNEEMEMKFCQKHYSITYQWWMKMGQVLFAENITVTYDVNSSLVVIALLRNQQLMPT